jgi:hypothetical protein
LLALFLFGGHETLKSKHAGERAGPQVRRDLNESYD